MDDQAALFRTLATVVHRSAGGTADMNALWPIHSDAKADIVRSWTADELTEMTQRANMVFAQQTVKRK